MKKFFTLVSVAMAAMSLNAQVEKYTAITFSQEIVDNGDGTTSTKNVTTLSAEFAAVVDDNGVATNVTAEGSVVNFGTANVSVKAVGGSTPADVPDNAGDNTMTHVDINADGTVNSWKDIMWQQKNQGDIQYAWVQGTGNPSAGIKAEQVITDDVPATYIDDNGVEQFKYRPVYTVYNPDGSLGAPKVGLHYQFTAKVAGTMKVAVWINKGNRKFYVVDGETGLPVAYKAEGYINGQSERVPNEATEDLTDSIDQKKWLSSEEIQAIHDAAKVGADGVDSAPYIVGAGNQPFFGNVIFEMVAGKTYYVFNDDTQIGFQGYEFTPAGGGGEESTDALFSWSAGVAVGGTVVGNGADAESVTAEYLKVSSKKANIANDNITITLENALQATDKIEITAYRDKDTDANGTLHMAFENGKSIDEGDVVVWNNIALGQEPNTNTYEVGEGAGSKVITLARSKASTNVFITKFVIIRGESDGIGKIEIVELNVNAPMYNVAGQQVTKGYKGIVIQNGKKYILR